jgi:DNA-directed RNA polymerase specialized sigma24 family protein
MTCSDCDVYRSSRGKGTKTCLRCEAYKKIQMASCKRDPIIFEDISRMIEEDFADNPRLNDVLDVLRLMPLDVSLAIVAKYLLGASHQEIADVFDVSVRKSQYTVTTGCVLIKNVMRMK